MAISSIGRPESMPTVPTRLKKDFLLTGFIQIGAARKFRDPSLRWQIGHQRHVRLDEMLLRFVLIENSSRLSRP